MNFGRIGTAKAARRRPGATIGRLLSSSRLPSCASKNRFGKAGPAGPDKNMPDKNMPDKNMRDINPQVGEE
jgi:hypothetical protein